VTYRVATLPKWAQDHISNLESKVEQLTRQVEDGATEKTGVWLEQFNRPTIPLADQKKFVKFHRPGARSFISAAFIPVSSHTPAHVAVMASDEIHVRPQASNSLDIFMPRMWTEALR
jgi:hypothetical protein